MLKIVNFTFFHNVFYAICILQFFNSHISVLVCSFFEFGMVSKWCIREWVKVCLNCCQLILSILMTLNTISLRLALYAYDQNYLPYPHCFLHLLIIIVIFELLSTNALNLDDPKFILFSMGSNGKGLTHSLIHQFETVPNSTKLQTTIEMWLLKAFKIQIA